jgi:hypothetical protein
MIAQHTVWENSSCAALVEPIELLFPKQEDASYNNARHLGNIHDSISRPTNIVAVLLQFFGFTGNCNTQVNCC